MPLDPYTARLFQIESGGDPNAITGSNQGLGQFGPAERAQYGITDSSDPQQQVDAVARERAAHSAVLGKALGRDPTPGELYLSHQQGIAGGPALLTADPSIPAWQAIRPYYKSDRIAQQAITGNIPRGSPLAGQDVGAITAGDFANFWKTKFEGGTPAFQAIPRAQAPAGVTPFAPQMAAGAFNPSAPTTQAQPGAANPAASYWQMIAPQQASSPPQLPLTLAASPRPPVDMSRLQAFLNSAYRG